MENNIGYLYVDAMCTVDTYFCGMPVLYEKKEDGQYHKKQCYCRHIQGSGYAQFFHMPEHCSQLFSVVFKKMLHQRRISEMEQLGFSHCFIINIRRAECIIRSRMMEKHPVYSFWRSTTE